MTDVTAGAVVPQSTNLPAPAETPEDVLGGRPIELLYNVDMAVTVELGLGSGAATVYTSDLSYDYVKINADYRT